MLNPCRIAVAFKHSSPGLIVEYTLALRSILWLSPCNAGPLGPSQALVNMVDTMASPFDALGYPPRHLSSVPSPPRFFHRSHGYGVWCAYLISRLLFSARVALYSWADVVTTSRVDLQLNCDCSTPAGNITDPIRAPPRHLLRSLDAASLARGGRVDIVLSLEEQQQQQLQVHPRQQS